MFLKVVCVLILAVVCVNGSGKAVKFHNCKSQWELKEVRVNPCETTSDSCPLKKGTSPEISVTFVPNKAAKNLTVSISGIINGVAIPFPLPSDNGCLNSGLTCPLAAGQEYTYKLKVPVLEVYPNVAVLIRWNLQTKHDIEPEGEQKHDVCFIMKTKIVG